MPNTYFQFKQFTVYQDQSAMKVCTDACIFGAWFAEKISSYTYVLDIGSGTGLLMLMLAQKMKSQIHGIEIDLPSFKQLKENLARSGWKDKLRAFVGDARNYAFPGPYDFIICNPPFYSGDLKSEDDRKNMAKHDGGLNFEELLNVIEKNLNPEGSFGVLLPAHRVQEFINLAENRGFHLLEKLVVKQSVNSLAFRGILHFSRKRVEPLERHELAIHNAGGKYTQEFVDLLKDYYLYL